MFWWKKISLEKRERIKEMLLQWKNYSFIRKELKCWSWIISSVVEEIKELNELKLFVCEVDWKIKYYIWNSFEDIEELLNEDQTIELISFDKLNDLYWFPIEIDIKEWFVWNFNFE